MVGAVIGILCGGAGFFLLARLCHAVCHQARVPWMLALANPADCADDRGPAGRKRLKAADKRDWNTRRRGVCAAVE